MPQKGSALHASNQRKQPARSCGSTPVAVEARRETTEPTELSW